jgi:hypothetical protein
VWPEVVHQNFDPLEVPLGDLYTAIIPTCMREIRLQTDLAPVVAKNQKLRRKMLSVERKTMQVERHLRQR